MEITVFDIVLSLISVFFQLQRSFTKLYSAQAHTKVEGPHQHVPSVLTVGINNHLIEEPVY